MEFKSKILLPTGIFDVSPLGVEKLELDEELTSDDKDIFYKSSDLTGSITFQGSDYTHLIDWEKSEQRTEKCTLIIYQRMESGYGIVLRYIIPPDDCLWNADLCQCTVRINKSTTTARNYEEIKDTEYNAFDLVLHRESWHFISDQVPAIPIDPHRIDVVDNGLLLYDLISVLLKKAYPLITLKSGFFGWNQTQTYTIGNNNKLTRLVIGQKSDVYRRRMFDADPEVEPATILLVKLSKILADVCGMFNLKCIFEGINVFRIEHITYYDATGPVLADATTGKNLLYNKSKLKGFEYDNSNRYSAENFKADNKLSDINYVGYPITYNINNGNNVNVREIDVAFHTYLDENTLPDSEFDYLNGIYMAALKNDGTNIIWTLPRLHAYPNLTTQRNILLGWMYLANDYHKDGKSYRHGRLNDQDITFNTKLFKVQKTIRIEDCYNQLDLIGNRVTTKLGLGRVQKVKKVIGNPYADADIYFSSVPEGPITDTIAKDDKYHTKINTGLNTQSGGYQSLLANDILGNTVFAETRETDYGGTVQTYENGHFSYTPKHDFDGIDSFDYYLISANSKVSTATCYVYVRIQTVYLKMIVQTTTGVITYDNSRIQYFRDPELKFRYDTTDMGLTVYVIGYDISSDVAHYSFTASGDDQEIPSNVPPYLPGVTPFYKRIDSPKPDYIMP